MAHIITITNPLTGQPQQVIQSDYTAQQIDDSISAINNGGQTASLVNSFNNRSGAVMPQSGDYTAAQIGAAPDGYGLGAARLPVIDSSAFSSLLPAGFYFYYDTNIPIYNFTAGLLLSLGRNTSISGLNVQIFASGLSLLIRYATVSNTNPAWRWLTPPMQLGVEYLTAENYIGKPVYTQLVNFGTLPAASAKNVSVLPSGCNIFEVKGICNNGVTLPGMITSVSNQPIFMYGYQNDIVVSTSADYGSVTATAVVKYTKTTD